MASVAELIVSKMHPEHEEGGEYEEEKELGPNGVGMVACMEEFKEALNAGKPTDMAKHLMTFFELCETQPHEESGE